MGKLKSPREVFLKKKEVANDDEKKHQRSTRSSPDGEQTLSADEHPVTAEF